MEILGIIPCGRKKIWDRYPNQKETMAKDAYIGHLHQLCMEYAERHFSHWLTISAKHGFLLPEDLVPENYDLSFRSSDPQVVTSEFLRKQLYEKKLHRYDQIVVLTGKKYKPIIYQTFDQNQKIEFPLLGTRGIGDMQKLLRDSLNTNQLLHTEGTE